MKHTPTAPKLIQFTHPIAEHIPSDSIISTGLPPWKYKWNTKDHKRKFLQVAGRYLEKKNEKWVECLSDDIKIWCEAEWDTKCDKIPASSYPSHAGVSPLPRFCHHFVPVGFEIPGAYGINTDPYVFGNVFKYLLCRQEKSITLRSLPSNSIILFGSYKQTGFQNGKKQFSFFLDTVFVVDKVLCNVTPGKVPPSSIINKYPSYVTHAYYRRTLSRLAVQGNKNECSHIRPCTKSINKLSLYIGRMYSQDNKSLFSFVPIIPNSDCYPRPILDSLKVRKSGGGIVEAISPNPGPAGIKVTDIDSPNDVWNDLMNHLISQNYFPGVFFNE